MNEFDKKIDSIEKLAKEAERLAKNLQGNPFSVFDRIAKDIQEQKDNAIAMEFTKCIGELLRKNGVVPKMTEYTRNFETDNTFETRYGVSIDELDFSEHDKVFEDKIAKLEKELEEWEEEARVVKKQRDEQLKSFRKGIEPYVDLLHMHETIAELKQHIDELKSKNESLNQSINEITTSRSEWIDKAVEWQQKCEKLESKETESLDEVPDSITIDGYKCKIIKTESGLYISRDEIYSIIDKEKEPLKQKCKELEDRHQSDCIEINRLNTTIDVLIHKVEYLRQFAGLE